MSHSMSLSAFLSVWAVWLPSHLSQTQPEQQAAHQRTASHPQETRTEIGLQGSAALTMQAALRLAVHQSAGSHRTEGTCAEHLHSSCLHCQAWALLCCLLLLRRLRHQGISHAKASSAFGSKQGDGRCPRQKHARLASATNGVGQQPDTFPPLLDWYDLPPAALVAPVVGVNVALRALYWHTPEE